MDHASPASDRRRKRSRPPQAEPPGATVDSATPEPLVQQRPALEASPQPPKRRRQVQQHNTLEGVLALVTADAATMEVKNTEPVPQRWVALEPSPRPAKQRRRHKEQDTAGTDRGNHVSDSGCSRHRNSRASTTKMGDARRLTTPHKEATHSTDRSE